jgi:hypothetical protein
MRFSGPQTSEVGRHVLAVPLRTAIARLHEPGLGPLAPRVVLKLGVPADYNRVQIAAVVRLHPEPHASPQGCLAQTRTWWHFADQAKVRSGQPRKAQGKPLIERPARPLTRPERLAHDLIARHGAAVSRSRSWRRALPLACPGTREPATPVRCASGRRGTAPHRRSRARSSCHGFAPAARSGSRSR